MGVGQELTNGLKRVGHIFSFMLKPKKCPPPAHININGRSLKPGFSAPILQVKRIVIVNLNKYNECIIINILT